MSETYLTKAQILLLKAAEDEQTVCAPGIADAIRGFHAQQAIEKLLKALLSQLEITYERTHQLERLVRLLQAAGENLPHTTLPLGDLNDFAVFYRYDLPFQYAVPKTEDVLSTVRQIREFVHARIHSLSKSSGSAPV
ncbi:HEPN domain-containing protein [Telmatobacter bradus]|uniref:HEPN domain-containing protein n=1 Tax=Telmatobacter bradus TaxID=474953 RepID=UPI003B438464